MDWLQLKSVEDWSNLLHLSHSTPVILFKHSSRCSLSMIARQRIMDHDWPDAIPIWWLDVIQHREISRQISIHLDVHHESPQVLLLDKGECFWDEDHLDIQPEDVLEALASIRSSTE